MSNEVHTINLKGCSPTPLAHYLKALGILRLVSEQVDSTAVGWWKEDSFWLRSKLDEVELQGFFLNSFVPTPIVVPWSGSDFFSASRNPDLNAFLGKWPISASKDRPKGELAIDAVSLSQTERLKPYREMIHLTFESMKNARVLEKDDLDPKKGKQKPHLLTVMRAAAPDRFLPWIDVTSVVFDLVDADMSLNCLLGGGGGSDGNAHFSDNFMQCVWLCLHDFDEQRRTAISSTGGASFQTSNALGESLWQSVANGTKIKELSPALFNSMQVGGANASAGYSADAASNPWDYILMLEGTLVLAGAVARRHSTVLTKDAAFPFSVNVTPIGNAAFIGDESNAMTREVWLPLWERPMKASEAKFLFAEARTSVGKRNARNGVDIARSIAGLGIDRGISQFQRIALLKGRIGGDNYFTACDAGRFRVKAQPEAEELLAPLDHWLDRFRRSATGKTAPARAGRALRRLESSILNLCKRGDPADVQETLIALGEAETSVAISKQLRDGSMGSGISPLPFLNDDWLMKAYDGSCEFRLAAALASVAHSTVGPIRRHLEPIDSKTWRSRYPKWASDASDPAIVWTSGSLTQNLCAVLNRRLIDVMKSGKDEGCNELLAPLRGRLVATLPDIAAFIDGAVNDERIESLFKALCLIDFPRSKDGFVRVMQVLRAPQSERALPDAGYALLKLCYLPHKLNDVAIVLTPRILRRAMLGDGAEATRLASRRLTASGFVPAAETLPMSRQHAQRTAAALVFPISMKDAERLSRRVLRHTEPTDEVCVAHPG